MKCPRSACNAENPDANRYCGMCGTVLDADQDRIERAVTSAVSNRTEALRVELIKECETCEFKIVMKVQARLIDWAKQYAVWTAAPWAAVVFVLSLFGLNDIRVVRREIKASERNILDPSNGLEAQLKSDIQLGNANLKFQFGDYAKAEDILKNMQKEVPGNEDVFSQILLCERARNDFDQAARDAKDHFPPGAKQFSTYNDAGYVLVVAAIRNGDLGMREKAKEKLDKAKDLAGDERTSNASVLGNLALWYAAGEEKDFAEAIDLGKQWSKFSKEKWNPPTEDWFKDVDRKIKDRLQKVFDVQIPDPIISESGSGAKQGLH